VFDLIAGGHDSGLEKTEFGLIFYQNPEVLGYRDALQNKKMGAVVVPVNDYLSISSQGSLEIQAFRSRALPLQKKSTIDLKT
jgi:hypothetical protein